MTDHKSHTLAATLALLCLAAPAAHAWDNTINGNGQIIDGGGQGQQQGQRQNQIQNQRQRQMATGGSSVATGGAAAGGTATIAPGAGAATIAPGAINAGGNNVTTTAPPGFALPSFGGGQCATVGFGIAISPSGGGAFGPAWESTNCRNYYIAVTLIQAGRVDQGMRLLSMITPEAAAVMASVAAPASSARQPDPTDSGAALDLCTARPGWTAAQLAARYPQECRR